MDNIDKILTIYFYDTESVEKYKLISDTFEYQPKWTGVYNKRRDYNKNIVSKAKIEDGEISVSTPLGKALLIAKEKEDIVYKIDNENIKVLVIKIE